MIELTDKSASRAGPVDSLLKVDGLSVEFRTRRTTVRVVDDVSFDLEAGRTLGLVGESGSGKSVIARAILGLTGQNGRIVGGRVVFDGTDLVQLSQARLRRVRGREIAMVFQEPRRSLDPSFTVGQLVGELARSSQGISRKAAGERALELLERVRIPGAARRMKSYPHELSGGMCQRVVLAMALAGQPRVLIADESTTALDVTVQSHILDLIRELQRDLGLAVLFITHDLGVVAQMCDRVAVMYAGQVVESAPTRTLFRNPSHPYTQALLDSLPQQGQDRMTQIPGLMPTPGRWPGGCRFAERCTHHLDRCVDGPVPLDLHSPGHAARCVRVGEINLRGTV